MLQRLNKFVTVVSYAALLVLSFHLLFGHFGPALALHCVVVNALWLTLTICNFKSLLTTYFDRLSRMRVIVPLFTGLTLVALTIASAHSLALTAIALVESVLWISVYRRYEANRRQYSVVGHGPLPKNFWVNPPAQALRPGDVLLMSGRISRRTRNSVGHMELVLCRRGRNDKNKLVAASSYMENGVVENSLRALCEVQVKGGGRYVVMRPNSAFTSQQNTAALELFGNLLETNDRWRKEQTSLRQARVERALPEWLCKLPVLSRFLPKLKRRVLKQYLPTGYDWTALYTGIHHDNRWTCMGVDLMLLHAAGVRTNAYGTGLLGLGTGFLNPLMPIRFLSDPNFHPLTQDDAHSFEESRFVSRGEIAKRAYHLCEARQGAPGTEVDDWLLAEKQLRRELELQPFRWE